MIYSLDACARHALACQRSIGERPIKNVRSTYLGSRLPNLDCLESRQLKALPRVVARFMHASLVSGIRSMQ